MNDPRRGPEREDVAVAALFALPFALYVVVLRALSPPSEAQWAAADPILRILPRGPTLWVTPVLALALAAGWWRAARPSRRALGAGARDAVTGAFAAVAAIGLLRAAAGPVIPSFIPPEESAGPGYLLSMTAGLEEELVCRLGVMPLLWFGLRARAGLFATWASALVGTGLVFALWHAMGEGSFSATYFMTRLIIPGIAMSAAWLVSPAAIVVAHCVAHLLIPALFLAP